METDCATTRNWWELTTVMNGKLRSLDEMRHCSGTTYIDSQLPRHSNTLDCRWMSLEDESRTADCKIMFVQVVAQKIQHENWRRYNGSQVRASPYAWKPHLVMSRISRIFSFMMSFSWRKLLLELLGIPGVRRPPFHLTPHFSHLKPPLLSIPARKNSGQRPSDPPSETIRALVFRKPFI